ncbi:MAG TPA: PAS domain S-box protein [Bryobacteraceae bacterium]|nr:PAS domain S-box protein [Bryobacteraceae bacterium]
MDNSLASLAENVGDGSPSYLQRLEFLVSTVPVAIYTCKADGDFGATFVSDGVRALWGYEPEEFLRDSRFWIDRLHPEDADRIIAGLGALLAADQYSHEYRFRTKSGEYRWVRDELRLLRGTAAEPLEIVGHCIDITERREAEAALRESEERYALVTEATLDGIFDWNLETGDSHLSPRLKEILGYTNDGHADERPDNCASFFARLHPEDRMWLDQLMVLAHAGQALESFEREVRFQRKDGSYCWVAARGQAVRNAAGRPTRFIGSIHDITERKRSEETAAFLASIVQSSEDSIVGNGLDGIILSWNASSERFWGYAAEEVIGKHVKILFPPERVHEFERSLEKIQRDQPVTRFETVRARKDGSLVPVSIILSPVKDPHGKLLGVAAIYRDLTARKEAEDQLLAAKQAAEASAASLRVSEERYALATQATYDGIFDWNLATSESYLSPRFKEILGYSADELSNDPASFIERVHPEDRAQVSRRISGTSPETETETFEDKVRVCCKDGGFRWVASRGRLVRSAEGKPLRFIGSIRDITVRVDAEAKLAASEKRLRDILDSLFGFVGLYTLDGTVLYVNRAPLEAADVTVEEVVGKPFWETYSWSHSPEERGRLRTAMARAAGGETVRYEANVLMKGGRQIVVDAAFGPLRNERGRIVNIIGFGVDITARKEAEARLMLAIQMAEVASRAKSEFLANMSHEIRTPMNGIIGLTEVVLESELSPEQREYLGLVKASADSLMTIIGDILDISKIQAGKVVLHPKEFWIRDLMTTTINGFEKAALDKNLRLTCDIHPEIPDVLLGDPDCLRQILVNLLGNAIKFTSAGEVKLSIEVSSESSDHLHFRVHDSGIGISPGQRQRIFEPFTQVDGSSRREFGGTGLGLAISAQLVEMMGGEIWVASDGRAGSTFHFTARLKSASAAAEPASHAAEGPRPELATEPDEVASQERRKFPRFKSYDAATLNLLSSSSRGSIDVQVVNVSNGGLRLWTAQSLDPGTMVEIQRGDEIALASVRYCVPADPGFHAGVRFRGHYDKL